VTACSTLERISIFALLSTEPYAVSVVAADKDPADAYRPRSRCGCSERPPVMSVGVQAEGVAISNSLARMPRCQSRLRGSSWFAWKKLWAAGLWNPFRRFYATAKLLTKAPMGGRTYAAIRDFMDATSGPCSGDEQDHQARVARKVCRRPESLKGLWLAGYKAKPRLSHSIGRTYSACRTAPTHYAARTVLA